IDRCQRELRHRLADERRRDLGRVAAEPGEEQQAERDDEERDDQPAQDSHCSHVVSCSTSGRAGSASAGARAGAAPATRTRRPSGKIANTAPRITMPPPSQIQTTSGLTKTRSVTACVAGSAAISVTYRSSPSEVRTTGVAIGVWELG